MTKKLINPKELFDGSGFGMSQAVVETASNLVFVSGQVDWTTDYQVTETTVAGQLTAALKNLKIALEEAGSSVAGLLHVRIYVRGEFGEHMESAAPIMAAFLGDSRPAMTAIGVASLASPETLVEIEAVAKCG